MRTLSDPRTARARSSRAPLVAALVAVGLAAGCGSQDPASALAGATEAPGAAVAVDPSANPSASAPGPLPEQHPAVPVGDPASNNSRVGRAPRRMNVDQLRAALRAATGFTWVARRRVSDPDAPSGFSDVPDADMLEVLAATLGRADYVNTTRNSIDPGVTFSKLAGDAARAACRASVANDSTVPREQRRILRVVEANTTVASDRAAVRGNLALLARTFWGRTMEPGSPELDPLERLFERASTAPAARDANGTMRAAAAPVDGWRAVCIAMATDPQFLTY